MHFRANNQITRLQVQPAGPKPVPRGLGKPAGLRCPLRASQGCRACSLSQGPFSRGLASACQLRSVPGVGGSRDLGKEGLRQGAGVVAYSRSFVTCELLARTGPAHLLLRTHSKPSGTVCPFPFPRSPRWPSCGVIAFHFTDEEADQRSEATCPKAHTQLVTPHPGRLPGARAPCWPLCSLSPCVGARESLRYHRGITRSAQYCSDLT